MKVYNEYAVGGLSDCIFVMTLTYSEKGVNLD